MTLLEFFYQGIFNASSSYRGVDTMDGRSWLWRRKSSEKSPAETESSGSISSHSERFSDDLACATHSSLSTEIASKSLNSDYEANANVKVLTEKLSALLLDFKEKEATVKQHAKVAEEAVSGWEKAEEEASALKHQIESVERKNSALENRANHLDGALKECVRQLRQAREEENHNTENAILKNSQDFQVTKSELEIRIADLQAQPEFQAQLEFGNDPVHDLPAKLEVLEKENSSLKLQLLSQGEELEIMIIERDLSNQAAETASKQHLECIKKLTKTEAECRRLRVLARKPTLSSYCAPSINLVETLTNIKSDSGERLMEPKNHVCRTKSLKMNEPSRLEKVTGKTKTSSSFVIGFMDDFLEMERIASLPSDLARSRFLGTSKGSNIPNANELQLKQELESSINRITQLEEKVEMVEVEKIQLEMALTESKKQIGALQNQLNEKEERILELKRVEIGRLKLEMALTESRKQLVKFQSDLNNAEGISLELGNIKAEKLELAVCLTGTQEQLEASQNQLKELEGKLTELNNQLGHAIEAKETAEKELKVTYVKTETNESRLRDVEAEARTLLSEIASLEEDANKERALSAEYVAKCEGMQTEISKLKNDVNHHYETSLWCLNNFHPDSKMKQEKELAAGKFTECQKTIASLGRQLRCLATLEDFLIHV